jgi:uncharacterized protein YpuA (DUF1002 family)
MSSLTCDRPKRRTYCQHENLFIKKYADTIDYQTNNKKWEIIAKLYSDAFPMIDPPRTPRELKKHYETNLNTNIKSGPLTKEEIEFMKNFVAKNGRKWKMLSVEMNRNENQLKNSFFRKVIKNTHEQNIIEDVTSVLSSILHINEFNEFPLLFDFML